MHCLFHFNLSHLSKDKYNNCMTTLEAAQLHLSELSDISSSDKAAIRLLEIELERTKHEVVTLTDAERSNLLAVEKYKENLGETTGAIADLQELLREKEADVTRVREESASILATLATFTEELSSKIETISELHQAMEFNSELHAAEKSAINNELEAIKISLESAQVISNEQSRELVRLRAQSLEAATLNDKYVIDIGIQLRKTQDAEVLLALRNDELATMTVNAS